MQYVCDSGECWGRGTILQGPGTLRGKPWQGYSGTQVRGPGYVTSRMARPGRMRTGEGEEEDTVYVLFELVVTESSG